MNLDRWRNEARTMQFRQRSGRLRDASHKNDSGGAPRGPNLVKRLPSASVRFGSLAGTVKKPVPSGTGPVHVRRLCRPFPNEAF